MLLLGAILMSSPLGADPLPAAPAPKPVKRLFVEFDLSPAATRDCDPGYTIDLQVTVDGQTPAFSHPFRWVEGGLPVADLTEVHFGLFEDAGFDAEIIGRTQIRVYGRSIDGKFHPVVEGKVLTKGLKKDQVPTVKNPPKG